MADHSHPTPTQRFFRLLSVERADLWVLTIYAFGVILLTLTVPLAMQSLVNTIAHGLFEQPIIVLSLLVLAGLAFASVMQIYQMAVVESIQLRVFAKTALNLADRLVRVRMVALRGEYAPELVNRFFDVLTIQKSLSKLLLDGFTGVLQALVGILVLAMYSTTLLAVDLVILILFLTGLFALGIGGLRTSIEESKAKYAVAEWLEDLARCHVTLKLHGDPDFVRERADNLVVNYLDARREHFRITIRQLAGYFTFAAVANAGGLAVGAFQVLGGQMTLGQLVAAQLILNIILGAMDKIVRKTDEFFDLLTGLDKVGHVTDLEVERAGGRMLPEKAPISGAKVCCRGVRFGYRPDASVLTGVDLELAEGERVSLVGASGAGKSTLSMLLAGLEEPDFGSVEIDGVDVREAHLESLRRHVAVAGYERELFDGTVEENIRIGREHVHPEDVRWAIEMAELTDEIALLPAGLKTPIVSGGSNLSRGQIQRLLIARALVDRPRLLLLDEAFTGIDERVAATILDRIFDPEHKWTIIDISHEPEVVVRTEKVYVLADGRIKEVGSPSDLAQDPDSEFARLFPYMCSSLRKARRGRGGR